MCASLHERARGVGPGRGFAVLQCGSLQLGEVLETVPCPLAEQLAYPGSAANCSALRAPAVALGGCYCCAGH